MSYNVKPGDTAIITNSLSGPNGPSVGRRVKVHADAPRGNADADQSYSDQMNALNDPQHYCPPSPYEKEHSQLGKIWPVTGENGLPFTDANGNVRGFVDVPDQWLQRVEPPPPVAKTVETSQTLDTPQAS